MSAAHFEAALRLQLRLFVQVLMTWHVLFVFVNIHLHNMVSNLQRRSSDLLQMGEEDCFSHSRMQTLKMIVISQQRSDKSLMNAGAALDGITDIAAVIRSGLRSLRAAAAERRLHLVADNANAKAEPLIQPLANGSESAKPSGSEAAAQYCSGCSKSPATLCNQLALPIRVCLKSSPSPASIGINRQAIVPMEKSGMGGEEGKYGVQTMAMENALSTAGKAGAL
jgi:hypothetical protein